MDNEPIHEPEPSASVVRRVDTEVPAKAKRRTFTAKYKLRILDEYDAAGPGERGAILRREGLYTSHLSDWRASRKQGALDGLAKTRGRKAKPNPQAAQRIAELERDLARTREELRHARLIVEVQGKVSGLLGLNFDSETSS